MQLHTTEKKSNGTEILDLLLKDDEIREVMIKNKTIRVQRVCSNQIEQIPVRFDSVDNLKLAINRLLKPIGATLDQSSPTLIARFSDRSQIYVVMTPESLEVVIRKPKPQLSLNDLVEIGSLDERMRRELVSSVDRGLSILICGTGSSGKTTLLNALGEVIDSNLRVATIEDSPELTFDHPRIARWEVNYDNTKDPCESKRDLILRAVKHRTDRIILGEISGDEAYDYMQTISIGYRGVMATIHADNPNQAMMRLICEVATANKGLPEEVIPIWISRNIDIIVQTNVMSDGTRKVTEILEVVGESDGSILINSLIRAE